MSTRQWPFRHKAFLVAILVSCFTSTFSHAVTWYVATNGNDNVAVNDGTSGWHAAFATITNAVQCAADGHGILVSNGTYVSTGVAGNRSMVNITNGITLTSVNGPDYTTLDGNAPDIESALDAPNTVLFLGHVDAVVEGFTITNGLAIGGSQWMRCGGGVIITNGGTLRNCVIVGNAAGSTNRINGFGGGIYIYSNTVAAIISCVITGNVTDTDGMGGSAGGVGGGVYINGSGSDDTVLFTNCHIVNNICDGLQGGGVYARRGMFVDCVIACNRAAGTNANCGFGAGIAFQYGGQARNCVISNNCAYRHGSAVRLNLGGILRNCFIYGNTSATGSAVIVEQNGTVQNCTMVNNVNSNGLFGGMYLTQDGGLMTLENNIFWLNLATNTSTYSNYYRGSGAVEAYNNCVGLTSDLNDWGDGNIKVAPMFIDNISNFRLQRGSPCINTGTNQPWMADAVDLDGRARLDRFNRRVDMGCYEYISHGTMFWVR